MPKIHLSEISASPIEYIPYLSIPEGSQEAQQQLLPILTGRVQGLPNSIHAIILASDLQGVMLDDPTRLLGEGAAEVLSLLLDISFPHIDKNNVVVLLGGDLYADLSRRGQGGDPTPVWQAFSHAFGYTVGIGGNHDHLETGWDHLTSYDKRCQFLHHDIIEIEGIRIAGLSGIIGRPDKNFRWTPAAYTQALTTLLRKDPDIILTHLSPQLPTHPGEPLLLNVIEKRLSSPLWCCGHVHWPAPGIVRHQDVTFVNVDARMLVLLSDSLL